MAHIFGTKYPINSFDWQAVRTTGSWGIALAVAATLLCASGSRVAMACALESPLGFEAFSVPHKGVISVAVATRAAVEDGHLSALPARQFERRWVLSGIGRQAAAHMRTIAQRDQSGPPLSVLLTQTGAWMRLNDSEIGARYHTAPANENELTILLPDTAYAALLKGMIEVEDLANLKVLRVYGNGDSTAAIEVFREAFQDLVN